CRRFGKLLKDPNDPHANKIYNFVRTADRTIGPRPGGRTHCEGRGTRRRRCVKITKNLLESRSRLNAYTKRKQNNNHTPTLPFSRAALLHIMKFKKKKFTQLSLTRMRYSHIKKHNRHSSGLKALSTLDGTQEQTNKKKYNTIISLNVIQFYGRSE
ncbi:unnamed protein product, partial [Ixodes pacificus]